MPLTHLIIRILKVALLPLSLGGCVATAAAPVTLPIWFLFSIVVLFRPIKPESYARFTQIIVIQCLMMAAFGLVAWIDLMERNTGGSSVHGHLVKLSRFTSWELWLRGSHGLCAR